MLYWIYAKLGPTCNYMYPLIGGCEDSTHRGKGNMKTEREGISRYRPFLKIDYAVTSQGMLADTTG